MSEAENTTSNEPVDDIEAAAGAAAETAKANPPEKRADAPPKPVTATGKKRPKPKKAKKKKATKAASNKTAQPSGPEQAQIVQAAVRDARPDPDAPVVDDDAAAEFVENVLLDLETKPLQDGESEADREASVDQAKADLAAIVERIESRETAATATTEAEEIEAERMAEITGLAEKLIELTMRPLEDDETQADRNGEIEEIKAELADVAKRGDTAEMAALCLAQADEAQAAAVKLRALHGELVTLSPVDDGRSHAERVKDVQKRSVEIRERRVRDRLTLLAKGAGKSPLDLAAASAPRKSPADADTPPATE